MSKVTVEFSKQAQKILQELAINEDTTKSEIVRRAIALYSYVQQATQDGTTKLSITQADSNEIKQDIILTK